MRIRILAAAIVAAWLVASAGSAQAALSIFTDKDDFLELFNAMATEDFEASPLGPFMPGETDLGLFDITLPGMPGLSGVQEPGLINGSRELLLELGVEAVLLDDFNAAPVFGFGATWSLQDDPSLLQLALPGMPAVLFETEIPGGTGFLGVVSEDPFTSLNLALSGPGSEVFQLDDVVLGLAPKASFEDVTAVPEPGTLAMLAVAGVAGVAGARLRRRVR